MKKSALILALVVSFAAAPAFAQNNKPSDSKLAQLIKQRIKQRVIQHFVDALDISQKQGDILIPYFEQLHKQKRGTFQQVRRSQAVLKRLLAQKPVNETAVKAELAKLKKLMRSHLAQARRVVTKLETVLTPTQQAKLVLMVPELKKRARAFHHFIQHFKKPLSTRP